MTFLNIIYSIFNALIIITTSFSIRSRLFATESEKNMMKVASNHEMVHEEEKRHILGVLQIGGRRLGHDGGAERRASESERTRE